MVIQTLQLFLTVVYVPSVVVTFSAVAVAVSHFFWALFSMPSGLTALFIPKESLSVIVVCMACVPSALGRCEWVVLMLLLVLMPYALKGLLTFLVSDHTEISLRITQGMHDIVHSDLTSNASCGFTVIGIGQSQGIAAGESFPLPKASLKDETLHWVEDYNL